MMQFLLVSFFLNAALAKTFVTRIPSDPGNLNWNHGGVAQVVVQQLMEGLTLSGKRAEPIPGIAKSWKEIKTRNQNKIIFTLRKDAKWIDGKPVCAAEFEEAWKKVLSPDFSSPYAHLLFNLKNAKKFHSAEIKDSSLVGVRAKNCHTLEVELEQSTPSFIALTSHWVLYPTHLNSPTSSISKLPITNGPYFLKEWKPEEYYLLERNPHYFGKKAEVEFVKILIIPNDSTALNLFDQKKLDWTKDLPSFDIKRLSSEKSFKVFQTFVLYHLGFTQLDLNARCALAYSLNKEQIPVVLGTKDIPAYHIVPSELSPQRKRFQNYDLKHAQDFFQKSEFFKQNKKIDIFYYSKDSHQILMEWVAASWKKAFGIEFNLTKLENKIYWKFLAKTPPQIFLSGTTAEYAHPHAFLSEFFSQSVANWGRFKSTTYDHFALESLTEKAETELLEKECADIPLYFRTTSTLVSPEYDGFFINPLTYVYLKNLKIKK